jgi:cysteine-rich repeat protein
MSPCICNPICGDGIVIPIKEPCDDGNLVAGDGCSPTCGIEYGWNCYTSNFLVPSHCWKLSSPTIINYYMSGNDLIYI